MEIFNFLINPQNAWWVLLTLFFAGVLFEWYEVREIVGLVGAVTLIASYFKFDPNVLTIAISFVVYIAIGVTYSFWRYRTYVASQIEYLKSKYLGTITDPLAFLGMLKHHRHALELSDCFKKKDAYVSINDKLDQCVDKIREYLQAHKSKYPNGSNTENAIQYLKATQDATYLTYVTEKETAYNELIAQLIISAKQAFNEEIKDLNPLSRLSKITAWIAYWPFSMMVSLSQDIVLLLETIVKKWSLKVYKRIYHSLIDSELQTF